MTDSGHPGAHQSGGVAHTGQVWDPFVRLFHWLLVLAVAGSWLTAELGVEYREYHFYCGYTVAGLIVFRLLWGVVGTSFARFTHFLRGPGSVMGYINARRAGMPPPEPYPGHNPLGGYAVLAILLLLISQVVTGLFADDDILFTGPWRPAVSSDLADTLTGWHHRNFNLLLVLLGLHVAAIALYRFVIREDLLPAMFHGRKPLDTFAQNVPLTSVPWIKAGVVIAIAVFSVWLLLALAPEPSFDEFYY